MRIRLILAGLVLILLLLACNLPAGGKGLATPTATISLTFPIVATTVSPLPMPTFTFLPDVLATFTATSTPDVPIAWPKDQPVNCRFGPGVVYAIVSALNPQQTTQIVGKNAEGTWWYVRDPGRPGGFCWVAMSVTNAAGNLEGVAVVAPPLPAVTDIRVRVEPVSASVACNAFPYTFNFSAELTTNGPAAVSWRWELSTGETSPAETLIFAEADTKSVQDSYRVSGPGDYWVRLHVLSPNEMSQKVEFSMSCTP
jgi:hypothetical protein